MTEFTGTSKDHTRLNSFLFGSICVVLFFSTIAFGAVHTWALGILSVVVAFMLMVRCAEAVSSKSLVVSLNLLQLPIAGLFILGLIQLLPFGAASTNNLTQQPVSSLSIAPYSTRLAIVQLCVYLVFFATTLILLDSEKRVRRLVYVIIIFGTFMGFFGILQHLAGTGGEIYGIRNSLQASPFGSFINSHHFAAFMEMTIALPLALLFGSATKKDKRALLVIAAVVMGMTILLTSSRGGLLSLFGVVGFIVIANILIRNHGTRTYSDGHRENRLIRNFALLGGGMAILILILGIAFFLTNDSTIDRVISMQTNEQDLTNGRFHFWNVAWQIFKDYPIIGSGLDSFGTAFPNYDTWNGQFRLEYAHNDYLQTLAEAGIAGFLCVVGFIYLLFRKSLQMITNAENSFMRNAAIGALAGCFGIMIHSFFDFPLRTPANTYFFLVFAALATVGKFSKKAHTSQ